MITIHAHHPDGAEVADCLPNALAIVRRYFMNGGREQCRIEYDGLDMTITLREGWNMDRLP